MKKREDLPTVETCPLETRLPHPGHLHGLSLDLVALFRVFVSCHLCSLFPFPHKLNAVDNHKRLKSKFPSLTASSNVATVLTVKFSSGIFANTNGRKRQINQVLSDLCS